MWMVWGEDWLGGLGNGDGSGERALLGWLAGDSAQPTALGKWSTDCFGSTRADSGEALWGGWEKEIITRTGDNGLWLAWVGE